jgi:hypothetical protein
MGRKRIHPEGSANAAAIRKFRAESGVKRVEIQLSPESYQMLKSDAEYLSIPLSELIGRLIKYALTNRPAAQRYASVR